MNVRSGFEGLYALLTNYAPPTPSERAVIRARLIAARKAHKPTRGLLSALSDATHAELGGAQ